MVKTVSIANAKNHLTGLVREVEAGAQVIITKDREPAVRIIAEEEYQRMVRQLAVDDLRTLGEKWRARGITWREIHEESRQDLESRP
ncbi:MAG: type II toxin-antitoxin system prevent-host-death family antitoxin [Acidobacteriota bacterium]